jgi:uncharacterized membrane protein
MAVLLLVPLAFMAMCQVFSVCSLGTCVGFYYISGCSVGVLQSYFYAMIVSVLLAVELVSSAYQPNLIYVINVLCKSEKMEDIMLECKGSKF